jgi:protein SCO1/2
MAGPTLHRSSAGGNAPSPPLPARRAAVWLRLTVVAALSVAPIVGCGGSAEHDAAGDGAVQDPGAASGGGTEEEATDALSGYSIEPPPDVSAVVVPRADGSAAVSMPASPGGIHLVYFGYTACPDVCPTTMSDVRRALGTLDEQDRAKVSVSMVTIDPDRDQGDGFTDYVSRFIADGAALRTDDPAALRAAAEAFGADYEVVTDTEGEVEVSHTGDLYAVDDQGRVILQWPFGTSHESLARDLSSLLASGGRTGSGST